MSCLPAQIYVESVHIESQWSIKTDDFSISVLTARLSTTVTVISDLVRRGTLLYLAKSSCSDMFRKSVGLAVSLRWALCCP